MAGATINPSKQTTRAETPYLLPTDIRQSADEAHRRAIKSFNTLGDPIRLDVQILAIIEDPICPYGVYIAENTGNARRITLNDNQVSRPYLGPSTAATCLAHSPPETGPPILFAGSIDNGIYAWLTPSGAPYLSFRSGHTGAVTALVTTPIHLHDSTTPSVILISSGLDGRIIIWATGTGEKLFFLGPGVSVEESILSLAIPPRSPDDESPLILYTSGKKSPIRRFLISTSTNTSPEIEEIWSDHPIRVHTAAVEVIHFDLYGELYTASLDGDVTRLNHEQNWKLEQRIHTGGRPRSVAVDNPDGWIITVGGDEEVRVWDRALQRQEGSNLRHLYSGHYGEVMGAVVLDEMALAVTVSLDGTVRRWSVDLNSWKDDESEEEEMDEGVGLCIRDLREGNRVGEETDMETFGRWDGVTAWK